MTLGQIAPQFVFGTVSDLIESGDTGSIDVRVLVLVGVAFLTALSAYGYRIVGQRFTQGVLYLFRRRQFQRLSRLGVDYYDRELPGQVSARLVWDLDILRSFFQDVALFAVTQVAQIVLAFTAILVISPSVFPVVLVVAVVIVGLTAVNLPLNRRVNETARDRLGHVTAKFEEDFLGRREIAQMAAGDRQETQVPQELLGAAPGAAERAADLEQLQRGDARDGPDHRGDRALHLRQRGARGHDLDRQRAHAAAARRDRHRAVLGARRPVLEPDHRGGVVEAARGAVAIPVLPPLDADAPECPPLDGDIVFDHVDFTYPHTGRQVLSDVSFAVAPGRCHRVGRHDRRGQVERGEAARPHVRPRTRDGARRRPRPAAARPRVVSGPARHRAAGRVRVPRHVASNIAYGRPDAARTEIEAAVRAVGAADVLGLLAGGLDSRRRGRRHQPHHRATTARSRSHARGSPIPTCSCSTKRRPRWTRHSSAR